ncbi:uncharacterized protein LOC125068690 isoform X1 [Vanessa atalanta]|uniref:uncharacterized protein LOC125068690 isoform X1 n=2 Tax=Vanessa atalanta TaxID=42275 RepID=UPI001FCCF83E|nr:uncharacterized protein LOC125068690 isoform X1 [Vanessa atalanta]
MHRFEINPKRRNMSRKFLFCFPLRLGNIVFGYIVIIFGLTLLLFEIYQLYTVLYDNHTDSSNIENKNYIMVVSYFVTYATIGFLLSLFATIFTIGAYKLRFRAIKTFFVYSFIHIFFTIVMIAWETLNRNWWMLGVLAVSDVILMASLFGVKYFIDAVKSGRVYHRPETGRY